MRPLLLLLAVVASVSSQAQLRSFFNLDNPSTIEGKILNYKAGENNRFFTLRIFEVTGRHKDTAVQIRPDGSFYARYVAPNPNEIGVAYRDAYITLIQRAGNTTTLHIDDKLWRSNENKASAIVPTDEMSKYASILADFQYHFSKQSFRTAVDWQDKNKTDEELVDLRLQKMKEEQAYVELFFGKKYPQHQYVRRCAMNRVTFDAGYEILFTLFTSWRHKSYTHDQLFALVKHFPVDSTASVLSNSYYRFACKFAGDLDVSYNVNPKYENLRKQSVQNKIPFILDQVDSTDKTNQTGIWYKLLYYNFFVALPPAQSAFYETRFYGRLHDRHFREKMDLHKAMFTRDFAEFNLLEKLKSYDVEASLKLRLVNLLEGYKNKYIFMDFWGTWCGPCMAEMPYYPEFIKRLKDKNIVFLFMGVDTPEKEAQQVKEKFRIEAEFITLNDSEHAILKNLLSISFYPTHLLLKPGYLVTDYRGDHINSGDQLNPGSVEKIGTYFTATK